jgi:hypothetical protein
LYHLPWSDLGTFSGKELLKLNPVQPLCTDLNTLLGAFGTWGFQHTAFLAMFSLLSCWLLKVAGTGVSCPDLTWSFKIYVLFLQSFTIQVDFLLTFITNKRTLISLGFVFLMGAGDQTQGFMHAWQVLYP